MIRELMSQSAPLWAVVTNASQTDGRVGRVVAWVLEDAEVPKLLPVIARDRAPHATLVDGEDRAELFDRRAEADTRLRELTDPEAHRARQATFAELGIRPVTPRVF